MRLSFYGGAQQVTGANYLLKSDKARVLVDCGLFQCPRFCSVENYAPFRYDASAVDALFVTHAHIDHTGRIPKLVREGFKGTIYSTPPTKAFAEVMLEDSLGILEKEALRKNKEMFYNLKELAASLKIWKTVEYGEEIKIGDITVKFLDAGHILGSAMVEITNHGKKLLFTGDLGNVPNPLLCSYPYPQGLTHLIIESAYGDRIHEDASKRKLKLERAIEDTVRHNGVLMIPAFALERTQELLFELNELVENGRIPKVPIFLDSPLAIKATKIYRKYGGYFNKDAKKLIKEGDDLFNFPRLKLTLSTKESKAINNIPPPKIIIAGAGMMQGGRIVHHAMRYLPDKNNTILFIGYLAANSTGRRILEGARSVRIFGEDVPVRARVEAIGGYSAHADYNALMEFVNATRDTLEKVFVVQGEAKAGLFFAQRAKDYLGVESSMPKFGDKVEL